jgi:phosphatidylglycerol:prolipoprotein diacylglycerol transferase
MRPILFLLPGTDLRIHSYGVMMFVACAAALAMAVWRARREKVDPNAVYELATWLFLGGVIGARVFYFVQHPEAFHQPGDLFRTWQGGNVFYGCILGGLTGSVLYWMRRPFPFWRMADAVAPAVAIGAALGRIGCFLNGCCHGAVCMLPWAVRFPAGSHAWARQVNDGLISAEARLSLPVHPTQLYSALAAFLVTGLLLLYARRGHRPGKVMALLMLAYSATRWPIEALRSDEPAVFAGMTWSQNISTALILGGLAVWFSRKEAMGGDIAATTHGGAMERADRADARGWGMVVPSEPRTHVPGAHGSRDFPRNHRMPHGTDSPGQSALLEGFDRQSGHFL